MHSRTYEAGETLFLQGQENRGVFCVKSGLVGLRRTDENGNSAVLRLSLPGGVLGYPAFLGKKNHPNTGEVLTRSTVCFIEASQLRWIIQRNPELMESFIQRALTDLNRTEANCAALLTADLRCRLFHLLLIFYEHFGAKSAEGRYTVELPVQRKDLAALLGAKPESISRLINRLDREGCVRFEGRRVDFADLSNLAGEAAMFN
ncbi:MAG: Crp/Fnr family transcriptional regulator [Rhodomicrobium sp.]